jgi:glutathione synthase/RimK-type ligase-like ATP-grasp enzyme
MKPPCVLIVTNKLDAHADRVVELLHDRHSEVFRLNTEDLLSEHTLTWRPGGPSILSNKHHRVAIDQVTAVWYRKPNEYTLSPDLVEYEKFLREELRAVVGGIYRTTRDARWVNPIDNQRRASYKLLQLDTALQVGLEIPATIVTNDPDAAAAFADKHREDGLAIKAVGSGLVHLPPGFTIFTNRVDAALLRAREKVQCFPQLFQAYVPKEAELRITVVGQRLFTCEMETQSSPNVASRIDWRRYDLDNVPYKAGALPPEVEDRVKTLMTELGLVYGAIDMIRTPDHRYVFLEVNPSGQWLWVEEKTGLPISQTLADLLGGATPMGCLSPHGNHPSPPRS